MALKEEYDREGLISAINVIPTDKIAAYSEKCSSFVNQYNNHPNYKDWTYGKTELILRWVADLAAEETLLDIVEQFIGPDILLWNGFLPIKPPHTLGNFGWHQDATYWPVTPTEEIVSVWVALSPVDQLCGGMQMVKGSHLQGTMAHQATYDKTSMLRRGQKVSEPIDENKIVNIDLKPGQASFHHTLTLHRSGANESDNWRYGVGFNFASSKVKPNEGHQDSAILLRGSAEGTGFVLSEAPKSDLDETALQNFAKAQQLQAQRYADVQPD